MGHPSDGAQERLSSQIEGTAAQWRALGFLALAELLGMTLWFSASAVVPTLKEDWELSSFGTA
jgi:nitrate/nitrite transporter NarK